MYALPGCKGIAEDGVFSEPSYAPAAAREVCLCCRLLRTQSHVANAVRVMSRGMPRPRPRPSPSLRCPSFPLELTAADEVDAGFEAVADGMEAVVVVVFVDFASRTVKFALLQWQRSQSVLSAFVIQRWNGSF